MFGGLPFDGCGPASSLGHVGKSDLWVGEASTDGPRDRGDDDVDVEPLVRWRRWEASISETFDESHQRQIKVVVISSRRHPRPTSRPPTLLALPKLMTFFVTRRRSVFGRV